MLSAISMRTMATIRRAMYEAMVSTSSSVRVGLRS